MLELSNISYPRRLQSVSYRAPAGRLVGVIGANGSGKSTLLSILAGGLKKAKGAALWHSHDLFRWSPSEQRQQLAYLSQKNEFHEPVRVSDLLMTSQVNLEESSQTLTAWRERSIEDFHLQTLMNRSITELSGGEQRRVMLACVNAMNRPLILADEPIASLDLNYQLLVMDWLKAMSGQGKLVLVALHDLALAAQYCDELMLLHEGQLLASGEPNQVLSDTNLALAYKVSVDWLCNRNGVAMLARRL
ncbi:ABC transporter ATP-binding protein [Pseudidiomarina marina]|uniref:ABC transporter ATP-binding protein n=1 Tax=Pseudidiomarina marina TaxID=502366 RepID=UPI00384AB2F0